LDLDITRSIVFRARVHCFVISSIVFQQIREHLAYEVERLGESLFLPDEMLFHHRAPPPPSKYSIFVRIQLGGESPCGVMLFVKRG